MKKTVTKAMKGFQTAREMLFGHVEALEQMVTGFLNHCQDGECSECAKIICAFKDPMHFHHDGCPSCAEGKRRETIE